MWIIMVGGLLLINILSFLYKGGNQKKEILIFLTLIFHSKKSFPITPVVKLLKGNFLTPHMTFGPCIKSYNFDVWHKAEAYLYLGKDYFSYACCFSHITVFVLLRSCQEFLLYLLFFWHYLCPFCKLSKFTMCAPLTSSLTPKIFIGIIHYFSKKAGLYRIFQASTYSMSFHNSVWF